MRRGQHLRHPISLHELHILAHYQKRAREITTMNECEKENGRKKVADCKNEFGDKKRIDREKLFYSKEDIDHWKASEPAGIASPAP